MITANSYFSGAGLMDLGLIKSGIKILQSFEIDRVCIETLRMNFDHDINHSDITLKTVLPDQDTDIMVATFPCDHYSDCAFLHGTRNGDDLFLHFLRHLILKSPEMFIVENVPSMRAFPVVMETLTKIPGYYTQVFCPVETHTWLPQKRDRLILFGTKSFFNFRPPDNCCRPVKLKDIVEKYPDIKITDSIINRLNGKYRDKPIISDPDKGDIAPCVVAHYSKDRSTRLLVDHNTPLGVRPYTTKEWARLQGCDDTFTFSGTDNQIYRQIGNSVPIHLSYWIGTEVHRYFVCKPQSFDPFSFISDFEPSLDSYEDTDSPVNTSLEQLYF